MDAVAFAENVLRLTQVSAVGVAETLHSLRRSFRHLEVAMPTARSIVGFPARPGTDVLPTCSTASTGARASATSGASAL